MIYRRRLLGGWVFAAAFPAAAQAGGDIQILPTLMLIAPGGEATGTLSNRGDATATAQSRVKLWTQDDSGDILADTQNVVVSPPFIALPPGQSQLLRVADLATPPRADETAYRLLVNQLPAPAALSGLQIQLLIGFVVPVFVAGQAETPPDLSQAILQGGAGGVLKIYNAGGAHARLSNLTVKDSTGVVLRVAGLAGYALPKSVLVLKLPRPAIDAEVFAQTQLDTTPRQIAPRPG